MKIRAENKRKSRSQERAQMACKELKKAASDVFSEKRIDAAMAGRTFGR
jgi:hypothetical protein